MASGEAELVINYPPEGVIDFVLDLREYRKVDDKLGKIYWIKPAPDGRGVFVHFRPKLMGLPGPSTTQRVVVMPGRRIEITGSRRGQTRSSSSTGTSVANRPQAAPGSSVAWTSSSASRSGG